MLKGGHLVALHDDGGRCLLIQLTVQILSSLIKSDHFSSWIMITSFCCLCYSATFPLNDFIHFRQGQQVPDGKLILCAVAQGF